MSVNSTDTKNFTRGGQITLHNIRMFIQIIDKVMLIVGIIFICAAIAFALYLTTAYERYVFTEYLWSKFLPFFDNTLKSNFINPNGHMTRIKYSLIAHSPWINGIVNHFLKRLFLACIIAMILSFTILLLVTIWLKKQGKKHTENQLIKGDQILSAEITKKIIDKNHMKSDLIIGNLPLIKDSETAHLLFHGTTGSGKSTGIKELLEQIRKRGDRAIIYDKSCNYLEEFYEPSKDVLLNPLDERCREWNLWQECRDSADFDSLAAAQIPMPVSSQDPFWVNAARTIFSSAAFSMRNDESKSIKKLLKTLLLDDLNSLQRYLKGTEAETLVSEKIEKTAISIKSVLATYLKSMKYVKEGNNPFSIRSWIQDDSANNWLFITSQGDRHETLKPLITAWLDIAVNALLSLSNNPKRRIWLILDEVTSLQQLPYLTQAASEARKFGGCIVIGIQSYSQLEKLYGHKGAEELSSLLNTRFLFRQPDPEMARWSANNFGETIVDEVKEGISYGANTMRDGISINRTENKKQLLSYSEFMSLAFLSAYVRLPGNYPITQVHFKYKDRHKLNKGFVIREHDVEILNDREELPLMIADQFDGLPVVETQTIKKLRKKKSKPQPFEFMPE